MAGNPRGNYGPISVLNSTHRDSFILALSNILSMDNAKFTYAQIVDGIPTFAVAKDAWSGLHRGHPVEKHTALCDGAQERCMELLSELDMDALRFDLRLLKDFNSAEPGSAQFNHLLVEMTAVAVHEIAVYLHPLHMGGHSGEHLERWVPDTGPLRKLQPTLFAHPFYDQHSKYPNGVADMVGYWAEDRIFGGVVLFDRGNSPNECNSVWLHSNRKNVTFRIFRLTEKQDEGLIAFLLGRPGREAAASSPLPIIGDLRNLDRVDPSLALTKNVYRDLERERRRKIRRHGCAGARNDFDYPELMIPYPELMITRPGPSS